MDRIINHCSTPMIMYKCEHSRRYIDCWNIRIYGIACFKCDLSTLQSSVTGYSYRVPDGIYEYCNKDTVFGHGIYTGNPDYVLLMRCNEKPVIYRRDINTVEEDDRKVVRGCIVPTKTIVNIIQNLPTSYINPPDPVPEDSIRIIYQR